MMRRILAIGISLALVGLATGPVHASRLTDLQKKLAAQQRDIKQQQARLKSLQATYQSDQVKLREISAKLAIEHETLISLDAQMKIKTDDIHKKTAQVHATQATLKSDQATQADTLRAIQVTGSQGLLAVVLQARSFTDFVSRLSMVRQVIASNIRLMKKVQADEASLVAQQKALTAQEKALEGEHQQAKQVAQTLWSEQKNFQVASTHLLAAQQSVRQSITQDDANTKQLEQLIASLGQQGNGSLANIKLVWPAVGRITSPFGMRIDPVTHKRALHTGVDIGIPQGTHVKAACGGQVLLAQWVRGYGYTVVLDCGNGVSTLYAHASKLEVSAGDSVAIGSTIMLSGMTGWATGPHLHFEIRIHGKPVNPMKYMPPMP